MGAHGPETGPKGQPRRRDVPVDPHGERVESWQQTQRGGTRQDRTLREVTVSLPPRIGDYSPELPPTIAVRADEALAAITRLDATHGDHLTPLSMLLLRAESVASSKIERVEASIEDFARAAHGTRANASATSMVASAHALERLISSVDDRGPISLDDVLAAHLVLMKDDASEADYAGQLRRVQNWIGGSDHSPRDALYVPPPPATVTAYMEDLLEFANRDDVPVLAQAAVAHAQFESIHPFTDGNGRIGRALINTILRRRGVTSRVVVPLASALVAQRDAYFDVLAAYREGDAGPIIRAFAVAAGMAARESEITAGRLSELPALWTAMYVADTGRPPRRDSAAKDIIRQLQGVPFFTTEEMTTLVGGAPSSVYAAIERLSRAGILRRLTDRKRRQVWCAAAILDELEDLGSRVARKAARDPVWRDIRSQVIADMIRQDEERWTQLRAALERPELSDPMRAAIDRAKLSDAARAALGEGLKIPVTVRDELDRLAASGAFRDAIDSARMTESVRRALAEFATVPEPLRESMAQWQELSARLVRRTRLPDAVARSLEDPPGDEATTTPG